MKYFVGCLDPLTDACQSPIIYIACVYTGYYHVIRLHTFPDSLLYFFDTVSISSFLSRCSASMSTDPLFSFRSLSSARDKTIKTAGHLLTASAGGRGGEEDFSKRSKRKIKQRLCTGLCSA